MSNDKKDLVAYEHGNKLTIGQWVNGGFITLLEVTAGAVTQAQLAYYEANVQGRILQIEADLILKYFYGLE